MPGYRSFPYQREKRIKKPVRQEENKMEDKRKQMSELSLIEMKKAAGRNKAEADAFVKELF